MYLHDDWEDGASEANKNSASLWTLPSRKTNKSSSIFWWLAKVLGGSLCPRPTEDRWLRFYFMNSWSSLTLTSAALRLLLDMETYHYCMDQKHMDRLSLLKLDCCNMQSWVQWGVVKELAMVETRKAESRTGSRWEKGTDGRKGGTEIGQRVKGLAGRLIFDLTISTTIWTAQSWALKPASKSFELLLQEFLLFCWPLSQVVIYL